MPNGKMEDVIGNVLQGGAKKNALEFAAYLRANGILLEEAENYWDVQYLGKSVCFVWIDGSAQAPGPWTIWSDQEPGTWTSWPSDGSDGRTGESPVDEGTREIAWANVNFCASCGGDCSPGKRKTILGTEFDHVCNSAMAFTNPDAGALECAIKMVEIRISDIRREANG